MPEGLGWWAAEARDSLRGVGRRELMVIFAKGTQIPLTVSRLVRIAPEPVGD